VIAAALALWLALAQGAPAAKPAPSPAAPAPAPPAAAPYEGDMLRLAELLGALAYLRDLCDDGDGARFRERMAALIETDPRGHEARDQLAGAFNRGFDGYRLSYRSCTANAREAISAYLTEAGRLARDLAARYRGG
jgi:uncharacterized protein (TIGR02301 family)